jgi:catechol 2,3-dioxygenase-like lactoylglutathione lyase family enzyme
MRALFPADRWDWPKPHPPDAGDLIHYARCGISPEEKQMPATGMNHFTVLTDDVAGTVRFYVEVLGLKDGLRPPFGFPGAWLYSGNSAILHVIGGRSGDDLKPGVIDHMAFSAVGLSDTLARLAAQGIEHTCRRQAGAGPWQVFFFDPNGARIELDFAPDETPPR